MSASTVKVVSTTGVWGSREPDDDVEVGEVQPTSAVTKTPDSNWGGRKAKQSSGGA
jgi:hypothetical protein